MVSSALLGLELETEAVTHVLLAWKLARSGVRNFLPHSLQTSDLAVPVSSSAIWALVSVSSSASSSAFWAASA